MNTFVVAYHIGSTGDWPQRVSAITTAVNGVSAGDVWAEIGNVLIFQAAIDMGRLYEIILPHLDRSADTVFICAQGSTDAYCFGQMADSGLASLWTPLTRA